MWSWECGSVCGKDFGEEVRVRETLSIAVTLPAPRAHSSKLLPNQCLPPCSCYWRRATCGPDSRTQGFVGPAARAFAADLTARCRTICNFLTMFLILCAASSSSLTPVSGLQPRRRRSRTSQPRNIACTFSVRELSSSLKVIRFFRVTIPASMPDLASATSRQRRKYQTYARSSPCGERRGERLHICGSAATHVSMTQRCRIPSLRNSSNARATLV